MPADWDAIDDAALGWVVRTGEPDFADWEGFTAWLEADPRHAARYHALAADLATMTEALPPSPPQRIAANDDARPTRRGWMLGAVAASVAAIAGIGLWQTQPRPYAIETAPGATRVIALADGSRIDLNGATRLLLDHRDDRYARVERGEALFTVHHDAARPFRVAVGEGELLDVGTVFDVTRDGANTRVAVAEGAVIYNPEAEKVRLDPGQALRVSDGGDTIERSTTPPQTVGSWRMRRLDYAGAPISEVAADVSRALGIVIHASAPVAARPFNGTLRLDGLGADPARLGPLLGAQVRRAGDGWEIVATP